MKTNKTKEDINPLTIESYKITKEAANITRLLSLFRVMKRVGQFILIFFLGYTCTLLSQSKGFADFFNSNYRLTAAYTSRYTFIDGIQRPVASVKAGVSFSEKLRVGLGYAQLRRPYEFKGIVQLSGNVYNETDVHFKFWYLYTYLDYVFYKTKHWELSMPLYLGAGASNFRYTFQDIEYKKKNGMVFTYEPAISGHYKALPWLGVGADIGYRFMHVNKQYWKHQFNSPVYTFKVIVFWRELYESVKAKKILF
ncbi:MAG: hypothetical protein J0M08_11075 [Bacteroidetes bacterium]|nr:hypothetical protein [Bacteroidota bacterium]